MKYYFFQTIPEGANGNRLRPMPFQTDEDGRTVLTNLNVQGNAAIRRDYPMGTVFGSDMLVTRTGGETAFYSAGDLFPVSVKEQDLLNVDHRPSDEMRSAYNAYMASNAGNLPKGDGQGVFAADATTRRSLTLLDKLKMNPKFEMPTIEKDGFWVDEAKWWQTIENMHNMQNTLFVGPAGTGKTELVKMIADRLGLPCHIYDMGSMTDPETELHGTHRIGAGGVSTYDYARYVEDIQKEGIILFDEITRCHPDVLNYVLPQTDGRRELYVEAAMGSGNRVIKVHPKCMFMATGNTGAAYGGTKELDFALKDRFEFIEMDYLPIEQEMALLMKLYKIGKAQAQAIASTAKNVRDICERDEMHATITTRQTIRAARRVSDGWNAKDAMETVFLPYFEGTKSEGERAIVYQAILAN